MDDETRHWQEVYAEQGIPWIGCAQCGRTIEMYRCQQAINPSDICQLCEDANQPPQPEEE